MQEEMREELSLGLRLSSSWCSDTPKKRKLRDELDVFSSIGDEKFSRLIHTRERMMRMDPNRKGLEDGKGLELIHLLLLLATAVETNDISSAIDSLEELYKNASVKGDSIQRVVAYFADGLAARLVTQWSPFYNSIMAPPALDEELSSFTELYQASPFYQFIHFTANQAIMETFEEEKCNGMNLHVVDFNLSYGFQWPSLIQSLSDKATSSNPISLRITAFGRSMKEIKETGIRLKHFTEGFRNLTFEFEGLLRCTTRIRNLEIMKNATLVINLVFYLSTLNGHREISEALMDINSLKPSIVVLTEREGDRSMRSFLSGFFESLHYYAAIFDSLDDCLSVDSVERMRIENHLGREIKSSISSDYKEAMHLMFERLETWKGRMETNQFQGVRLSSRSISQAKLLLKIRSHCPNIEQGSSGVFRIAERDGGKAISLGWQERHLITVTTWRCLR